MALNFYYSISRDREGIKPKIYSGKIKGYSNNALRIFCPLPLYLLHNLPFLLLLLRNLLSIFSLSETIFLRFLAFSFSFSFVLVPTQSESSRMKFGKSLSNQIEETLPEWRDKFLSYKELKKKLKLIEPNKSGGERPTKRPRVDASSSGDAAIAAGDKEGMSREEIDFIRLLEDELEKFNSFFVEKEEEYIIRLKVRS